jgi:hypothetical protein
MKMLLVDGTKYYLWTPTREEEEFHPLIKEHCKEIFGKHSIYLPIEEFLISQAGRGAVIDGVAIVFSGKPEMYVVEVELSSHDLDKHIVEQINRFVRALKNPENRKRIADHLEEKIRSNPMDETFVKQEIGPKEIYKFILDLVSQPLKIVVIIENKDAKLVEACENLIISPAIKEFKTFVREGAPTVHAHLFEPIYAVMDSSVTMTEKPSVGVEKSGSSLSEVKVGDYLEVEIKTNAARKFALFRLPKNHRRFFPGYKVDFILETDIGDIKTKVTSAKAGTSKGDPDAGAYIHGGLRQWYDRHSEVALGRKVRFECVEPHGKYKLLVV